MVIARGVLTTQNFRRVGRVPRVLMSGTIDLSSRNAKLLIVVLPDRRIDRGAGHRGELDRRTRHLLAQSVRNPLSESCAGVRR
jgi:hypothetical protein